MTPNMWLAYVGLLFFVCVTPGPAVILTSAQAVARGVTGALPTIAGIQAGNLLYFVLSAVGLGAIIAASELAFQIIKYAGAAYLLFLGIRALRSGQPGAAPLSLERARRRAFVHGFANQLANPKSILFYAALLPQFIVPGSPQLIRDLAVLAITDIIVEVPILFAYAVAAARGGALIGRSGWRERLTGSALIFAGGAVLLTRRAS